MHTIYYNFNRKYLCDASGAAVSELPEIAFSEKPTWRIVPVDDSGTVCMPTGIASFRAAIAFDFNSSNGVAARTLYDRISSDASGISVMINANTEKFLAEVDGQETRNAFFELSGLDENNNRIFYLSFRCIARMVLDPDLENDLPEEIASSFLDRVTANLLLAQKADVDTVSAIESRVTTAEGTISSNTSAIGTKASQSDLTALATRVTTAEGTISNNTSAIGTKASQSDLTALATRVTTAEGAVVPAGTVISFAGSTVPDGYLLCNGAAVSRTTYQTLFAQIGTVYGTGDGSATFNLPDFRGKFLRGYLSGTSSALGTEQTWSICTINDSIANQAATYGTWLADYNANGVFHMMGKGEGSDATESYWYSTTGINRAVVGTLRFDTSRLGSGHSDSEIRPVNYAVNFCIKY